MRRLSVYIYIGFVLSWMFAGLVFPDIQLQPHQKVPVQYLNQHPEQKGLLLFHSLGSGKTYIALDYTEKNLDKKVIILLPEFLKSNWITQMKSFGVKNTDRYELVSLQESEKILKYDLSNTIVIVDEIHKLVQKMRLNVGKSSESLIAVYEKLKTAQKILLLTGTPVFVDSRCSETTQPFLTFSVLKTALTEIN